MVATFIDNAGNLRNKLFKNVQIDVARGRPSLHAEQVMDTWFQKKAISPSQVTHIYSEYFPCTQGCRNLLSTKYSHVQTTWSFTYDQPSGYYTSIGLAFRANIFNHLGLP